MVMNEAYFKAPNWGLKFLFVRNVGHITFRFSPLTLSRLLSDTKTIHFIQIVDNRSYPLSYKKYGSL